MEVSGGCGRTPLLHDAGMISPLTWSFVRDFHPLPLRDRRLVLRDLAVAGVDHRDDRSFFEWLAGVYRAGEAGTVDAALRRCCGKGEGRTSTQRAVAWLLAATETAKAPHADPEKARTALAVIARLRSDELAAVLDALEPNFGWVADEVGLEASDESEPSPPTAPILGTPDARHVAARLAAALDRLGGEPDFDLLLRADALADAIEEYLGGLDEGRRRGELRARVEAALAALDPDRFDGAALSAPDGAGSDMLVAILDAAEAAREAADAFAKAREAARGAFDAPRAERRAAQDRFELAEDAWEEARSDLLAQLDPDGSDGPSKAALSPDAVDPLSLHAVTDEDEQPPESPLVEAAVTVAPESVGAEPVAFEAATSPTPETRPAAEQDVTEPMEVSEPIAPEPITDVPLVVRDEQPGGLITAPAAPAAPVGEWDDWITTALASGRIGLALHLGEARDQVGGTGPGLPSPVLDGLLNGRGTRAAYDAAWHRYEALRDAMIEAARRGGEDGTARARTLVLLAGAIRPALFQSQAAVDVMEALQGELAAKLNPLVRLLADLRGSGIAGVSDIAAPAGETERRERAKAAREALEEWRRTAPARTASFQGASAIWQALVAPEGAIGRVMALAASGEPAAPEEARRLIKRLSDEPDALIDEMDEARSGRGRRNPIVGGARKQLRNFFAGAADLLDGWLRAEGGRQGGDDRHRQRRAELLRVLMDARDDAIATASGTGLGAATASVFRDVAEGLAAELQGRLDPNGAMSSDDELALLPAFPLNARRDVQMDAVDAPALAAAAAAALGGGAVPGPAAAFDRALELGGVSSAKRLLPHLPAGERAAAEARLERGTAEQRRKLADRARELRQRLDDLQIALTESDQLPESIERDMSAFESAAIDRLPLDVAERGDLADFPAAHRRLDGIEDRLEQSRAPVAARLKERVAAQEGRLGQRLKDGRALLDKGDLGTLTEYVAQVERHGSPGAAGEATTKLLRRFVAVAGMLGDKPAVDLARLGRAARGGAAEEPFGFSALPDADRARAEALLHGWLELRRAVGSATRPESAKFRDKVADVLSAIGFTGVRVEDIRREKAWVRVTVATDPLRSRERCLAPAFGSDADGRYAVAVILDGEERSALSLFDHLPDRVLLLAPAPLSPRLRRDLQRAALRRAIGGARRPDHRGRAGDGAGGGDPRLLRPGAAVRRGLALRRFRVAHLHRDVLRARPGTAPARRPAGRVPGLRRAAAGQDRAPEADRAARECRRRPGRDLPRHPPGGRKHAGDRGVGSHRGAPARAEGGAAGRRHARRPPA